MRYLLFSLSILLLLIGAGCQDQSVSPGDRGETGGPDEMAVDVREFFDKNAIPTHESEMIENLDVLDSLPVELIDSCDVYAITFLWGDLLNSAVISDTVDWSGTLTLDGEGVVHVRYEIDFEPGQDSVLIHDNPTFAIWLSRTYRDFDGLSFLVFVKWRNYVDAVRPRLIFGTGPLTLDFSFFELTNLDAYYPAGNIGGVLVHSRRIWQNTCPGGLFRGNWIKDSINSDNGTIDGFWMDHHGDSIGYLSGSFWTNNDGSRGFAGSVSGLITDQVILELRGCWYYDGPVICADCEGGHGLFFGHFHYLTDSRRGLLMGEFGDYSAVAEEIVMPMRGIWWVLCPWTDCSGNNN